MSTIRYKLRYSSIPNGLELGITMILLGLLAIAFLSFSGLIYNDYLTTIASVSYMYNHTNIISLLLLVSSKLQPQGEVIFQLMMVQIVLQLNQVRVFCQLYQAKYFYHQRAVVVVLKVCKSE